MIELIFDADCPHLEASRQRLGEALTRAGLPSRWTEWDRKDPQALDAVANFGIGLLIGAGLWNAWPRRVQRAASCPACKQPPDLQP